eukprot:NODE_7_length_48057_cov_0.322240.p32 type:complete len:104 gc:universal NODE_7_length_48057_cov_0.322240:40687-40376(-)
MGKSFHHCHAHSPRNGLAGLIMVLISPSSPAHHTFHCPQLCFSLDAFHDRSISVQSFLKSVRSHICTHFAHVINRRSTVTKSDQSSDIGFAHFYLFGHSPAFY